MRASERGLLSPAERLIRKVLLAVNGAGQVASLENMRFVTPVTGVITERNGFH